MRVWFLKINPVSPALNKCLLFSSFSVEGFWRLSWYWFEMDKEAIKRRRRTFSAKCLHNMYMKGICLSIGAKSSDILYNSLVFPLEEGRQTWSWCRCVEHSRVFWPSSFPGFEIPIVERTMQGGLNSMSIGYGSQYPWRSDAGVRNFTKLHMHIKRVSQIDVNSYLW